MNKWFEVALSEALNKIEVTSDRIKDTFPHVSKNGRFDNEANWWWTNGFWPGILWLAYRETKNKKYSDYAISIEEKLDAAFDDFVGMHHDVGFMWMPSSMLHHTFTGNKESYMRTLKAATLLAGRYNVKGQYIRAWNGDGTVFTGYAIIDCMMNIPLLYWASEKTGDPRYSHIAMAHADMVLREFIREDGSVYHIINFDAETGDKIEALGGQGFAPESSWSRGASWAIYGMALSYAWTKEERYLTAAKKVAHYFLANLHDDYVPDWDFRVPQEEYVPKDSSAAGCAACGMLEIAKWVPEYEKKLYQNGGERILKCLYENYFNDDAADDELIIKGTGNLPAGENIEVGIIYGDLFYLEGLLKLANKELPIWLLNN